MNLMTLLVLVAGLVLLVLGAELLVRGAVRLAAAISISPLVVGLTVVAFGTSSPELAVSVQSSLAGRADIALGNVVGSNIFNVLFILGLSALIAPLLVSQQLVRLDVPIMIGVSGVVWLLGRDGVIGRFDGLLLVFGLVAYTTFLIIQGRKDNATNASTQTSGAPTSGASTSGAAAKRRRYGWLIDLGLIASGLALLVLGSRWLVDGATVIASALGVSQLVIGLTIIAAGTSLPEVATSVIASLRGERDIAVGNVVGSNLFNLMAVLGLTGVIAPGGVTIPAEALRFDIPVMIAVAVVCLPVFFSGGRIARWEGVVLLGYYVAYTAYLILNAGRSPVLPLFGTTMLFVVPLTALTLLVVAARALRNTREDARST